MSAFLFPLCLVCMFGFSLFHFIIIASSFLGCFVFIIHVVPHTIIISQFKFQLIRQNTRSTEILSFVKIAKLTNATVTSHTYIYISSLLPNTHTSTYTVQHDQFADRCYYLTFNGSDLGVLYFFRFLLLLLLVVVVHF